MELTLTPDIEKAIKEQANRQGTAPERLALDALRKLFVLAVEDGDKSPESLADFLRGYIGVIQITIQNEDTNMITSTEFDFTALLHQLRSPIPLRTK